MDIEDVIHKYTGHDVLWGDLVAAHTHPLGVHLAHALERAAYCSATLKMPMSRAVSGADHSNAPRAGRVMVWGSHSAALVQP